MCRLSNRVWVFKFASKFAIILVSFIKIAPPGAIFFVLPFSIPFSPPPSFASFLFLSFPISSLFFLSANLPNETNFSYIKAPRSAWHLFHLFHLWTKIPRAVRGMSIFLPLSIFTPIRLLGTKTLQYVNFFAKNFAIRKNLHSKFASIKKKLYLCNLNCINKRIAHKRVI